MLKTLGIVQSANATVATLQAFLARRIALLRYLRKALRGETYFMNTCILTQNEILDAYSVSELSSFGKRYTLLALSIARVLTLPNGSDVLRACAQLLAEYEHYEGDTIVPDALLSINFRRGMPDDYYPDSLPSHKGDGVATEGGKTGPEAVKTTLHTAGGAVVYEHLLTPTIPFVSMDFLEVITTLIDSMINLYTALQNTEAYANVSGSIDAFYKMDRRLKHYIIKPITKTLTDCANKKLHGGFSGAQARFVGEANEAGEIQCALNGGLVFSLSDAATVLRKLAESHLAAAAAQTAPGSVAGVDSNILVGILPGSGEASHDLSADIAGGDSTDDSFLTDDGSKTGKRTSLFSGFFREKRGSTKGGVLSSKPPAELEKVQAAQRQRQLGAYFSGANGMRAELKRGESVKGAAMIAEDDS